MGASAPTNGEGLVTPKRRLRLWGAIGLSLGIVSPTLAMAGNGQGTVASVGKSVPLVFVLGAVGIALIAYGFIRLTQRYNHAGSAYALVGMTVGPRAGFFSGFAIMGAYLFFSISTLGAIGSFLNAFIASAQNNPAHPFHITWIISGVIALALAAVVDTRMELRQVVRILLVIEGVGILCMTILSIVIFAKGGAPHTGIDLSTFSLKGSSVSLVMGAIVGAFLSYAGFEGCAALGEETSEPKRNIPRALIGCVVVTSLLFIMVMLAQTVGFGTNATGLRAFETAGNSLTTLSHTYVGLWFSLLISFAAVISGFGALLSCSQSTSRLLFAMARDGLGPKQFAKLETRHGTPRNALVAVFGVILLVEFVAWAVGHPVLGTGDAALDDYFYFAVIGAMALMVAYFMVEIGAIVHLVRDRREKIFEVVIPILGAAMIGAVFYYNVKSQSSWKAAPFIALAFAFVGLVIAFAAPGVAKRVGRGLARELGETDNEEPPTNLSRPLEAHEGERIR